MDYFGDKYNCVQNPRVSPNSSFDVSQANYEEIKTKAYKLINSSSLSFTEKTKLSTIVAFWQKEDKNLETKFQKLKGEILENTKNKLSELNSFIKSNIEKSGQKENLTGEIKGDIAKYGKTLNKEFSKIENNQILNTKEKSEIQKIKQEYLASLKQVNLDAKSIENLTLNEINNKQIESKLGKLASTLSSFGSVSNILKVVKKTHEEVDKNNFQSTHLQQLYSKFFYEINDFVSGELKKELKNNPIQAKKDILAFAKIITGRGGNIDNRYKSPEIAEKLLAEALQIESKSSVDEKILILYKDITGDGLFNLSDKTWEKVETGAKIGAVVGATVAVGIATGGVGAAAIVSSAVAGTVASKVAFGQGYDNSDEMVKDLGSETVLNVGLGLVGGGASASVLKKVLTKKLGKEVGEIAAKQIISKNIGNFGTLTEQSLKEISKEIFGLTGKNISKNTLKSTIKTALITEGSEAVFQTTGGVFSEYMRQKYYLGNKEISLSDMIAGGGIMLAVSLGAGGIKTLKLNQKNISSFSFENMSRIDKLDAISKFENTYRNNKNLLNKEDLKEITKIIKDLNELKPKIQNEIKKLETAEFVLGRKISTKEQNLLIEAYSIEGVISKYRFLKNNGFDEDDCRFILAGIDCGNPEKLNQILKNKKVSKTRIGQEKIEGENIQEQLDNIYKNASETKIIFDGILKKIGKETGGEIELPDLKKKENTLSKAQSDYNGDLTRSTDIVRGAIKYNTVTEALDGINTLIKSEEFEQITIKSRINKLNNNDCLLNVKMKNGFVAEVQIHIKETFEAKEYGFKLPKNMVDLDNYWSESDIKIFEKLKKGEIDRDRIIGEKVELPKTQDDIVCASQLYEVLRAIPINRPISNELQTLRFKVDVLQDTLFTHARNEYNSKTGEIFGLY